jgi:DNA repair protein RadA
VEEAAAEGEDISKLDGVGPKTATSLKEAGFGTVESLAAASLEDLNAVSGIGAKTAEKILAAAKAAG